MRYRRSAARCQSCKKPGGERAKCELLAFTVSDGSLPKTLLQRYRSTPRRRLPTGDGPGSWPIVRKGPTLPSRLATNWPRCHTATPAKSNRLPRLHRIYACPRSLSFLAARCDSSNRYRPTVPPHHVQDILMPEMPQCLCFFLQIQWRSVGANWESHANRTALALMTGVRRALSLLSSPLPTLRPLLLPGSLQRFWDTLAPRFRVRKPYPEQCPRR
jgi:hypothetical protein